MQTSTTHCLYKIVCFLERYSHRYDYCSLSHAFLIQACGEIEQESTQRVYWTTKGKIGVSREFGPTERKAEVYRHSGRA